MQISKAAKIVVLLFFLLLFCQAPSALSQTLIVSPRNDKALAIAKSIANQIPDAKISNSLIEETDYSLLITIGNESYQHANNNQSKPHIAAFVSYNVFKSIGSSNQSQQYAIYSDPDPHEVGTFIQRSLDKPRIAYIYTEEHEPYLHLLKKEGITINAVPLQNNDVFRTLSLLYRTPDSNAFFISENREIYNKSNILLILESLFRNRLPVISTNIAFYGKGSLLTIFVTQDAITARTIDVAKKLQANKSIPIDNFVSSETKSDLPLARNLNVIVGDGDD